MDNPSPSRPGSSPGLSRRDFFRWSGGGACLALGGCALSRRLGPARSPNILLLMADQLRGDALGADGNSLINTPNLDRLAREGALFRRAYTCLPSCTPARASLLTGLGPWRHGMLGYGRVAKKYANEMPAMLREAGYYGLGIGKMHWHTQRHLHGFHQTILDESGRRESRDFISDYHRWFKRVAPGKDPNATGLTWNDYRARKYALPEALHPTTWTGTEAVKFLSAYQGENPYFLKVSFARPHSPYDPPERFWEMYEDAPVPPASLGKWAERNALRRRKKVAPGVARGDLGEAAAVRARQGYYGSVTFLDEQIGLILKALEKRGDLENTLILFTADHGDMLGDHHLWRKTYAYEGSARIPMLIRWPEGMVSAKRGITLDQVVELRDVLPTFLDGAGVKFKEEEFDGRSMLSLLRDKSAPWREYLDLEHSTCYWAANQWTALTDGRTKYIYGAYDGRQELYDLTRDPGECHDLAGAEKSRATLYHWRQRMVAHLAPRGAPWVVAGDLGLRKKRMTYGPNYSGAKPGRKRGRGK